MNKHTWRKKTDAKLVTAARLRQIIRDQNGFALGLVGFSGSFKHNPRPDAQSITQRVLNSLIHPKAQKLAPRPLFLVSGATNLGVPRIGYAAAVALGCPTVGVTAASAIGYAIAPLDYLTVVGKRFGDESHAFISVIDELWAIGGGPQSKAECQLALTYQVPVTIIQGIGGIADQLSPDTFPATYINADQHLQQNP